MDRETLIEMVCEELDEAYNLHGNDKWGRHEFFGIISEEFEEMKTEIFKGGHTPFDKDKLQKEIIQVAAMCLRYLETGDRYEKKPIQLKVDTIVEPPAYLRKIMD